MKVIFQKIIILVAAVFCVGCVGTNTVFAIEDDVYFGNAKATTENRETAKVGTCETFLGMSSWDCGIDLQSINNKEGNGTEKLRDAIWLIVANIATDATILAAYLALGFIVYGGYRYIFAGGDVGKVASGRKTLTTAFIGLGIVILANVIFNGIKFALLKTGGASESVLFGLPDVEADTVFVNALGWAIGIAGVVAAIFLVFGGISYMTSSGDAGKLTKAKNTILYALIGLVIVGLAEIIMAFVSSEIRKSVADIQNNNQIIARIEENYEKQSY